MVEKNRCPGEKGNGTIMNEDKPDPLVTEGIIPPPSQVEAIHGILEAVAVHDGQVRALVQYPTDKQTHLWIVLAHLEERPAHTWQYVVWFYNAQTGTLFQESRSYDYSGAIRGFQKRLAEELGRA